MRKDLSGTIFNIQRFSVHDGPGIRLLVFMKGCPLRCKWCSNPEGLSLVEKEVAFDRRKCIACGLCVQACPVGAVSSGGSDPYSIDRAACQQHCNCAEACPTGAKFIYGQTLTTSELMESIRRETPFFRTSGGVTFGGGEVLMQADFVAEVLKSCKEEGIHTAIETSSYGSWEQYKKILENCDTIQADIKMIDAKKHKEFTGVGNKLILSNLLKVNDYVGKAENKQLIIRVPLVPEVNDSEEEVERIAEFVKVNIPNCDMVELLPFHNFGEQKYLWLDQTYSYAGFSNMQQKDAEKHIQAFEKRGVGARAVQW